ncbi:hypothetical protein BLOT_012754, partial [Blomia tropicalis]
MSLIFRKTHVNSYLPLGITNRITICVCLTNISILDLFNLEEEPSLEPSPHLSKTRLAPQTSVCLFYYLLYCIVCDT